MRFKTLLLILTIIATVGTTSQAQDIHFTQFDLAPLTLNPALTGDYEGTFRVGVMYRDQWGSVIDNPFRTPTAYLDAPILNVGTNGWLGAGVSVLNDQSGVYNLSNQLLGGSIAYHHVLGADNNTRISIGGQYNNFSRRVGNIDAIQAEDNWDPIGGGFTGASADANAINPVSVADVNAGIAFSTILGGDSNQTRITAGVSAFHLNNPDEGLIGSGVTLPTRIAAHAKVDYDLNSKWVLTPGLYFQTMAGATEANLFVMAGIRMNEDFLFQFGQGYRFGDATNTMIAIQYGQLRAGMSYDINISDLRTVSNFQGGFELGLSYIARIYSEPKSDPVIICPRF